MDPVDMMPSPVTPWMRGVIWILLALLTDLLIQPRTLLWIIFFFTLFTYFIQYMVEISEPIVLALATTANRSLWKHLRGVSLCLLLLVLPSFVASKLSHLVYMEFWLMIMISYGLPAFLQMLGTLLLYALLMVELLQGGGVERLDEIMYGVNAARRVLEMLAALCVAVYGVWELAGYSMIGAPLIVGHLYSNVWLRAESRWSSFLLRREAATKISVLPRASPAQLNAHNQLCSICFQEMSVAVVTACNHFFHLDCLRKWVYVKDTCPLCHRPVKPSDAREGAGSEEEVGPGGGVIWRPEEEASNH